MYPRAVVLAALLALLPSCGDEPSPAGPGELEPLLYGALVTPRVSYEADPLLADAYQALTGDDYQIAHTALSWAEMATGSDTYNWEPLDLHVERAVVSRVGLSIVLELFHGGEVEVPEYVEAIGWAWDDPTIIWELARFLRRFEERSAGMIDYLWLGEGPDRYVADHSEDRERVLSFYGVLAESARVIFPETRLGVLVSVSQMEEVGEAGFIRSLRDTLDLLALSVYPQELQDVLPDPETAVALLREGVESWSDAPLAVVETGYTSDTSSGSSEEQQSAFTSALNAWLHERPETLELFCWSPIHDAGSDLADLLAERRYPSDSEVRERFATLLATASLRRLDGSRKPAREVFIWDRP